MLILIIDTKLLRVTHKHTDDDDDYDTQEKKKLFCSLLQLPAHFCK